MKAEIRLKEIPHDGREFEVIWNPVRGSYESQRNHLKKIGVDYQINSSQLASLLADAYSNKGKEFPHKIMKIIKYSYFRSSTESLWLPKSEPNKDFRNGVVVYDNSNLKNPAFSIEKSQLFKKLEDAKELMFNGHPVFISKDKSVRYVPLNFRTGELNKSELARNPYNVALHLEEGAEKIAKVSSSYKVVPILLGYNKEDLNSEIRTVPALDDDLGVGWRFVISGRGSGKGEMGYSLGVIFPDEKK